MPNFQVVVLILTGGSEKQVVLDFRTRTLVQGVIQDGRYEAELQTGECLYIEVKGRYFAQVP